jgi:hypothetical protein
MQTTGRHDRKTALSSTHAVAQSPVAQSPFARQSVVKPPVKSMMRYRSTTVVRQQPFRGVVGLKMVEPQSTKETTEDVDEVTTDASYIDQDAWEPDVVDYVRDVFRNHQGLQKQGCATSNYMDDHKFINVKMRSILIDWLWEVWFMCKLKLETMFLTVQFIDRYLTRSPRCPRRKLQLLGAAAMFLAAKIEEIHFPDIGGFVYLMDNAYTRQDMIAMEGIVITALAFNLTIPTAYTFIGYYSQNVEPDCLRTRNAAAYTFGAVSLSVAMGAELPSQVAFGCMLFSLLNRHRLTKSRLSRRINEKRAFDDDTAAVSGRVAQNKRKPYDSAKQLSPNGQLAKESLEQKIRLLEHCAQLKRNHPCVKKVFKCAKIYINDTLLVVQKFTNIFPSPATIAQQMLFLSPSFTDGAIKVHGAKDKH